MEIDSDPIVFDPPLYVQRDLKIIKTIESHENIMKVLEVGCGECRLIKKLKNISKLQRIIGIDKCTKTLEENVFKLRPLGFNYVQKRDNPLTIDLYSGDILKLTKTSKWFEHQILIFTEVIEHVLSKDLDELAHKIFSILSPQFIIITTPNYEFNVCFGPTEAKRFRHYDHKFEWTRKEFQDWCFNKASMYSFTVTFDGVGHPPVSNPSIGFCTQIAFFEAKNNSEMPIDSMSLYDEESTCANDGSEDFQLVERIEYPHKEEATVEDIVNKTECELRQNVHFLEVKRTFQDDEIEVVMENLEVDTINTSFIEGDHAYIEMGRVFASKMITEYFSGNFESFKNFLKAYNFLMDDSCTYLKYPLKNFDATYDNDFRDDGDDDVVDDVGTEAYGTSDRLLLDDENWD